jgi:hypothetical protein
MALLYDQREKSEKLIYISAMSYEYNIMSVQLFCMSNFQHAVCNALGGNSLKINICNFIDCSCVLLMDIANERWRGKCSHVNLNDTLRDVAGILAISTFSIFAQRFNPAQGTGND